MLRKSLEERDHNAIASKSVVFYVVESNDDNEAVSDLMTALKIPQSYVKRSTRLGRKSAAIPPPRRVGGNRSQERDRKSELVLRSTIPNF